MKGGGAKVDTNGQNITIAQALVDGGGGGGLTKYGSGVLTLTGSNTYTGATIVNTGRLDLVGNNASVDVYGQQRRHAAVHQAAVNLGLRALRAYAGGTVEYNGATINGGYLRGPGSARHAGRAIRALLRRHGLRRHRAATERDGNAQRFHRSAAR